MSWKGRSELFLLEYAAAPVLELAAPTSLAPAAEREKSQLIKVERPHHGGACAGRSNGIYMASPFTAGGRVWTGPAAGWAGRLGAGGLGLPGGGAGRWRGGSVVGGVGG